MGCVSKNDKQPKGNTQNSGVLAINTNDKSELSNVTNYKLMVRRPSVILNSN